MKGYQENFLTGINLPLPTFSTILSDEVLDEGKVFHYPTYSVIMSSSSEKRSPVIVCLNVDQNKLRSTKRSNRWQVDPRIGYENQLDNDYYSRNPWDRGHMARRTTAAWGDNTQAAQYAANETFFYSNSCLQHANLNQDEWLELEEWVYSLKLDTDGKISSFSGPFYGDHDRTIRPSGRNTALIPSGFFKVVCFINKNTQKLDVRAFVMFQDVDALKDKSGRKRYNNQHYQVTVLEVEKLTGLRFADRVYEANPLFYADINVKPADNVGDLPESIDVAKPEDIIAHDQQRQTINDDIVDIFIATAMVNPANADAGNEWISLINLGSDTIDISGWTLSDNSDKKLDINRVLTDSCARLIDPGESVVIKGIDPLKLANTKDVIKLYDANGARLDWVNYTKNMVKSGKVVSFLSARDTLAI